MNSRDTLVVLLAVLIVAAVAFPRHVPLFYAGPLGFLLLVIIILVIWRGP